MKMPTPDLRKFPRSPPLPEAEDRALLRNAEAFMEI